MAAAGGSKRTRTWVVDVEEANKPSRWERHCSIYRVPACIKDIKSKAYRPQVVSLGPFHHGDPNLLPMEEHKRRALRHLLRRTGRPLDDFVAAMEDAAEKLESAYMGLAAGTEGERFLETMVVDGCFLLEVMRAAAGKNLGDYATNDPIFSRHGIRYMAPYIRRDMLMLENQLPLLVLQKLNAVESGRPPNDDLVNEMVLSFMAPSSPPLTSGIGLGLHPLDVLRRSMLFGGCQKIPSSQDQDTQDHDTIRPAVELYEAGIQFKATKSSSLQDISFRHGVLSMPAVAVDDSTEYMLLNMMAFERLHAGAGSDDVAAYVFFMTNIVDSARDVALLRSEGIIQNAIGGDKAVAKLFNGLSRDMVLEPDGALCEVRRQVNGYLRRPWSRWRANQRAYFRSPWAFLSLVAAVFLLVIMATLQTVYTVLQFYQDSG